MKATLLKHQIEGVQFLQDNKGIGALYWDPGCGKTLGALATYSYFKTLEPTLKLLIICPISLIHGAWTKEIDKFTDFNWYDLHHKKGKVQSYRKEFTSDIDIVNFDYLIGLKKFEELKTRLSDRKYMVVIDESSTKPSQPNVSLVIGPIRNS